MAFDKRNVAYDLSLFEDNDDTKTKRINQNKKTRNNVIDIPQEHLEKTTKKKIKPFKLVSIIMAAIFATSAIALIIQGQVQLTELNQKISNVTEIKDDLESLNTQTKMKVEAKYTPALVENYAVNKLDMEKVDSYQKDYIRFSQTDKVELSVDEGENMFESIANYISELWS